MNDEITDDIHNEIADIDQKIIDGITKQDANAVRSLMSDSLLATDLSSLELMIKDVSERLSGDEIGYMDQIHHVTFNPGTVVSIDMKKPVAENYKFSFRPITEESFVSLVNLPTENGSILCSLIWGKYEDEWKLNILRFGDLSFYGKNCPGHYLTAGGFYEQEYYIDAAFSLNVADRLSTPAAGLIKYDCDADLENLVQRVRTKIDSIYKFPIYLDIIESNPALFSVTAEYTPVGIVPMVNYVTGVSMNDSTQLQNENNQVAGLAVRLFPGLKENRDVIFYRAYEALPTDENKPRFFGFVQELN